MDGGDFAEEGEVATAAGAAVRLGLGKCGLGLGIDAEVKADGLQGAAGGGAHVAVVAHAGKAFGQDVEEPAADELMGMQGHDGGFAVLAAGPVEADVALVVVADEAFGADGAAFDVAGEVAQGGVAAAYVLELYVPGGGGAEGAFGGGAEGLIDAGVMFLQALVHEVAEACGEGAVVEEEVLVFGVDEEVFVRMPGEGGHDAVDVGVVLELASPGVEDAGEAGLWAIALATAYEATVGFGGGDIAQGLGAGLEDGVIEFFGMGQAGLA